MKNKPIGLVSFLSVILLLLAGCSGGRPAADAVIVNARVYTVDAARPWAEAVAVREGRILAVGTTKAVSRHKASETLVIDAGGRLVLPGMMDGHVHFVGGSTSLAKVDLAGTKSVAEIQERIRAFARENPEASWVQGRGWMYAAFPGNMPHKKFLDEIVPDRPAFMSCADGHTTWVNSRALAVAGVGRDTKDPLNGTIVRDEAGEPTGALLEEAASLVSRHIPRPTEEETLAALRRGLSEAARLGVVRAHGMGGEFEALDLLDRLKRQGELTIRLSVSMWVDPPGPADEDWKAYENARAKFDDDWLSLGGIKLMLDGVIDSGTGAMLDPYENQRGNRGQLFWEPEAFKKAVAAFNAKGLQVSTHAIGDAAVRLTLDAYEEAALAAGNPDVRNKIEHAEDIAEADIPRFGRLGVIASFQPLHANPEPTWMGTWIANVGPEREQRAFPWKAVLDGGGRLTFGSDWPVVTLSPWPGLQVAVTRKDLDGYPEGGWVPRHKVTLEEAVYAYTMGGAYAMHREKDEGSIEAGKLADLIMIDRNIFEIAPREISGTEVLLTMVGGRVVHDAR
ncbi:MAG: amidohydrolase [Candidatus Aminicenantes bacterium]